MTQRITSIVTGGGSGLGFATATQLVQAGYHVTLFDLNEEAGQNAVDVLGRENASFTKVNVTSDASVESAVQAIIDDGIVIRLGVNCAGVAPAKRILDRDGNAAPLDSFKQVIDINLVGTFNVCRILAQAMTKNEPFGEAKERGLLINTASVAGYEGQIGQTAYAASKGGIIGLCLPMARDLAPLGIRVNTIAPGVMGTPMLLAMPDKVQDALVHNVQFPKRLGLPEEFGKLVLHMLDNAYLNGETIRLDGALRMPPK
ncbi:SDR family NAD(P)-dependent oxidoreductase [Glaciecola sp. KUL10]|uniref:SDR family NAD(P)-dependent oxidoreductase n=1 Tax=Glaciecola sp. (strain KUL10) TaxID=2161813 RepID=UPI000D788760|nr:SDR family NAD(P)-dependent oxidoreductase [Glaciecola sp. KUL10]GBL03288.1 NAD-dependent epimerase/dehydratase [Glaciecola sp. KUL10]